MTTTLDYPECDHRWHWIDSAGAFICRNCGLWDDADGAA